MHSIVAIAPSMSGRPVEPGVQLAPQKSVPARVDGSAGEAIGQRLLVLRQDVDREPAGLPDRRA